jgi:uncharacterized protein YbaP (TraB family)
MKWLLALVISLLLSATAHAEPPVCGGVDLLEQLRAKRPAIHAEVMKEAAAVPNGQAIFWKIEKDGTPPSFLLGTAHVTDPRVVTLRPEVEAQLKSATTIALELAELRSAREMAVATLKHATLLVLPPGQSLWDLIPDADEPAIRNHPNLPAGSGAIYGYRPWIVAGMISVPLCESRRKLDGLPTLDETIGERSVNLGIPLVGLETVEEQLSVFARLPLDLQVKYLVAVAKIGPQINDYFETLIRLYERRQITAYMPFAKRAESQASPEDEAAMMAFVEEQVVRTRNHRMAERAARLFAKGGAFVAVGALHLPGSEGLVELLRGQGYKVSPIN